MRVSIPRPEARPKRGLKLVGEQGRLVGEWGDTIIDW